MPDRETLTFTLLSLALVWIVWIDIRPAVRSWMVARRKSDFLVLEAAYCESRAIKRIAREDSYFYENSFYLVVKNNKDSGQTIRRVQVRNCTFEDPIIAASKEGNTATVDIRNGEQALFEIGILVSEKSLGLVKGSANVSPEYASVYEHNVPHAYLSFEVRSANGKIEYGLADNTDPQHTWSLILVISGDDVVAQQVRAFIDMKSPTSPVRFEAIPTV